MKATRQDAHQLMHEGTLALANVEHNGFKVSFDNIHRSIRKCNSRIEKLEDKIHRDPIWKEFKKHYGDKANTGSPAQMQDILFNKLGIKPPSGIKKANKDALEGLDLPFIDLNQRRGRLLKCRDTYLKGMLKEATHKQKIHCSINLNLVVSYRSNVYNPNLTNVPVRDEEQMQLIRSAFVPDDDDYLLLEVDMSGAEVRVGACYHKDPTMLKEIKHGFDPHRHFSSKVFGCEAEEVSKETRQDLKSNFTFAQQYGSYYVQCAQKMWKAIAAKKLKTVSGVPLYEHLAEQGITRLGDCDPEQEPRSGTFEKRVRQIEKYYWEEQYPVYDRWRKDWYRGFLDRGYIDSLTGFRYEWGTDLWGIPSRNQIINYPVQGSSFHCLLKTIIYMDKWLKRHKMLSKIVCQIHDSIVFCVKRSELQDVLYTVKWFMLEKLPKLWKWIICPLEMEAAASDVSWADKKDIEI